MSKENGVFKDHLSMVVLSILKTRRMYGYELAQAVKLRSTGLLELREGVLYPMLHRMVGEGYVVSEWGDSKSGPRRRYYMITAKGRKKQQSMVGEWQQFAGVIDQLVGVQSCVI
jgi:DNA-binding PadR family transcriptional regulator